MYLNQTSLNATLESPTRFYYEQKNEGKPK